MADVSSKHCCWPLQAREEEFEQLEAEAGEEAREEEDVRPSLPWDGNDRDYSYKELLREHTGCLWWSVWERFASDVAAARSCGVVLTA